jgi:hypothetical protein
MTTMKHILRTILVATLAMGLLGCAKPAGTAEKPDTDEPVVQPMATYREQAETEITPENAEAELERLTGEIDNDK